MPGLDPALVRRIASSPEWTRHGQVARNLVCHPRVPDPLVRQLLDRLPAGDVRILVRSGRLRASVKRMAVRKLEQGGGKF